PPNSTFFPYTTLFRSIVDNKSRTRFMNTLKDLGLFSLQKSVFIGQLNAAELRSLKHYAYKNLNPREDKVFWLPTALDEKRLQERSEEHTSELQSRFDL